MQTEGDLQRSFLLDFTLQRSSLSRFRTDLPLAQLWLNCSVEPFPEDQIFCYLQIPQEFVIFPNASSGS